MFPINSLLLTLAVALVVILSDNSSSSNGPDANGNETGPSDP